MKTLNMTRRECPYEVGDILQTKNSTDPATRWPGTSWRSITTFLLGASAAHPVGETGGEETHMLTIAEMPGSTIITGSKEITGIMEGTAFQDVGIGRVTHITDQSALNKMPPYTAVYIWERIA